MKNYNSIEFNLIYNCKVMDLLASAIWLLIIINIFVELRITNMYFIIALLIIVLIEVWEKFMGNGDYNTIIMLFQGVILLLALYHSYGFNFILPALIIVVIVFLCSLCTNKYKDLYKVMIILTFLFTFCVLWMYNRCFIVSFPSFIFIITTFLLLLLFLFGR
jgi:hypothetical protein